MGGLFKGMTGGQALGYGQNMLGMGLETMFKQQAMDIDKKQMAFEKQKFDLLKTLQTTEANQKKTIFDQQQNELKKKEDYLNKMGQLLENLFDEEGNVDKSVAQKAIALQAANTGQISKGFLDIFIPKEKKPVVVASEASVYDPTTGEFKQAPGKQSDVGKEQEKEEERLRKEHDARVKRHYDALMDDWNKWAADQRKKGKDPELPDTVTMMKQAEAKARQEETWRTAGKPYKPSPAIRNLAVGATEPQGLLGNLGAFFKGAVTTNPFTESPVSKFLGIGSAYKFGGKPATPINSPATAFSPMTDTTQPIDPEEEAYVQWYSGMMSEEQARKEYRAMKKK